MGSGTILVFDKDCLYLQHCKNIFLVFFFQVWCTKYRDLQLKNQILTGVHSPGAFRIVGPLSNSDDFAKDFKCPKGSKMNPIEKCKVW